MNLIIICYFLLFEQTITLFETFNIIPSIPSIVSLCLTLPTYCLVFYSGIIRSWLLYYSNNDFEKSNKSNQKMNKYNIWMDNHRNTLGNTKFLYAFLLIIYIASIILLLIFGYIHINTFELEELEKNKNISINESYIYLSIIELIIIISPIVLSTMIIIIIYFCGKKSNLKFKSKILNELDKEIILILIWTIVSCLLRLIISILSNLIVMHFYPSNNSVVYTKYEHIYSLWNYNTSQFTGIYIFYTIWSIITIFILHLIQTRRPLSILNELNCKNSIQTPSNSSITRNSISHTRNSSISTDVGKHINIIHVTGVIHKQSDNNHIKYQNIPPNIIDDDYEYETTSFDDDDDNDNDSFNNIETGLVKCSADYSKIRKVHSENDRDKENGKKWKHFMKILNKNKNKNENNNENDNNENDEIDDIITYSKTMCNNTRRIEISLDELLLFKDGYNLFMDNLSKEYSTENLRFLTEVCQFKQRFCMDLLHDAQYKYHAQVFNSNSRDKINKIKKIKKQLEFENNNELIWLYEYKIKYGWFIELSCDIPLSEILTDEHWRSFYNKANKLYKKYIEQGSDCEINISYNCRNIITKYFNKPKPLSSNTYSERDVFTFDQESIDSYHSYHSYQSYHSHHSHDDLNKFKRRPSLTCVEEGFRGLKKSRSFHNVLEADNLYLDDNDQNNNQNNNINESYVKLHDINYTTKRLDKFDDNVYLLQIFDDAAQEIYSVLRRDSLHRFYETDIYNKKLLPKYLKKQKQKQKQINNNNNNKDIQIIFYYHCKCNKKTKCQCKHKYLKREKFETKAKQLKKKGIKRRKPLFQTKQKQIINDECKNNNNEKLKIIRHTHMKNSHFGNLSTPNSKQIYSHSPVSISRRSTQSATNSPTFSNNNYNYNHKKNKKNKKSKHLYHSYAATTTNWKLDTQLMHDNDNIIPYDDDNNMVNDKVKDIVQIVTTNIPPPYQKPRSYTKTADVYMNDYPTHICRSFKTFK